MSADAGGRAWRHPVPDPEFSGSGPAGRPRMLLLHGLGGHSAAWERFADRAGAACEVWNSELPWQALGDPLWPLRFDPRWVVTDLVNRTAADIVVAHSFSAGLVLEALAKGTIRPRAAVLVSPFYRSQAESFDWPAISHYLNNFHLVFAEALRLGEAARYSETHRDWLAKRLRDRVGPYGWTQWFDMYLRTPLLDLGGVTVPALVIGGDRDIAAPAAGGAQLAAALPDALRVVLPDCGHFPMLQEPERLAAAVCDFLRARGLPGAARANHSLELEHT
ncbi:alpha/beta hydrolase [Dactylosporangium vinaceum]|uniref:Alpha/beta fold hydrolase n=1 Tax=Dactylosporangium vinaceum TaxID=53362 RepID=A0ABV5ML74_9ACTN|nr:alpha/beta hydrolase [Dactylosporangium vinaceum]UAB94061.1 alpha/beta hydrolase [Dactylosporangium vinaceum]